MRAKFIVAEPPITNVVFFKLEIDLFLLRTIIIFSVHDIMSKPGVYLPAMETGLLRYIREHCKWRVSFSSFSLLPGPS